MEEDPSLKSFLNKLEKDGVLYEELDLLIANDVKNDVSRDIIYSKHDIETLTHKEKEQFADIFYLNADSDNFTERLLRILKNLNILTGYHPDLKNSVYSHFEDIDIYQRENMFKFMDYPSIQELCETGEMSLTMGLCNDDLYNSDLYIKKKVNYLYNIDAPFEGFTWYDMKIALNIHEEFNLDFYNIPFSSNTHKLLDGNIILDLNDTTLSTEIVKYISEGLETDDKVKILYLSNTDINTEGIKYIAKALTINTTLEILDLSHNKIGGVDIDYLIEALDDNSTLNILKISNNLMTHNEYRYYRRSARKLKNTKVTILNSRRNDVNNLWF